MDIRKDDGDEIQGEVGQSLLLFAIAGLVVVVGVLIGSAI
jgi:hypothetical protein